MQYFSRAVPEWPRTKKGSTSQSDFFCNLCKLSYSTRLHLDIRKSSARHLLLFARACRRHRLLRVSCSSFAASCRDAPWRSALLPPSARRPSPSWTIPIQNYLIAHPAPVLAGLRFLILPLLSVHTASFAHNLRRKLSPAPAPSQPEPH